MNQGYLTALFIANCFLSSGNSFSYDLSWSIKEFIRKRRCLRENCCSTCLGFSDFEFNFMTIFAFWTTLPVTCIMAKCLRLYGLTRLLIALLLISVLGNVFRIVSASLLDSHFLTLAAMITAESFISWAQGGFLLVRNHVNYIFFKERYLAAAVSTMLFSMSGSLLAVWTMNSFTRAFGISVAYGIGAGMSLLGPIFATLTVFLTEKVREAEMATGDNICVYTSQLQFASLLDLRKLHILLFGAIFGPSKGFFVDSALILVHSFEIEPPRIAVFIGIMHFLRVNGKRIIISFIGFNIFAYSFGALLENSFQNGILFLLVLVHQCHPLMPVIYHFCARPRDSVMNVSRIAAHFPLCRIVSKFNQFSGVDLIVSLLTAAAGSYVYSFTPSILWILAFIFYLIAAVTVAIMTLALWFAESLGIRNLAAQNARESRVGEGELESMSEDGRDDGVEEDSDGEYKDVGLDEGSK